MRSGQFYSGGEDVSGKVLPDDDAFAVNAAELVGARGRPVVTIAAYPTPESNI